MSERLHSHWKTQEKLLKEKAAKIVMKFLRLREKESAKKAIEYIRNKAKIKELSAEKRKLEGYLEDVIKENEQLDQNRAKQPKRNSNLETHHPFSSEESESARKKSKGGNIFDKLHSEAATKNEVKQMNEEIRRKREVQNCTFKPRLRSDSHVLNRSAVYERLSQSNRKEKQQYYELQKNANETRQCTFKPSLPKTYHHTPSRSSIGLDEEPVYSRLHKHAESIDQDRQAKALAKKDKELESCTFAPRINPSPSRGAMSINRGNRFNELYLEHEEKKRKLAKKTLEKEDSLKKNYTFKPQLDQSRLSMKEDIDASESSVPRYERLYSKHAQKEKMLERKRRELVEEEKKLRAFVSNRSKISLTASKEVASSSTKNERFSKLYDQDKVYKQKKDELSKKLMQERGINFTPRINQNSAYENDSRGVIERNEQFLKEKKEKLSKQVPTELKECTFVPKVASKPNSRKAAEIENNPRLTPGERLYAYFEKYEKNKEEYRQKHLDT